MADGSDQWNFSEWVAQIAAAVATSAAALVTWMFRRYRRDRSMLLQHDRELGTVAKDATVNARFSEICDAVDEIEDRQTKGDETLTKISEDVSEIKSEIVGHGVNIDWIKDTLGRIVNK